MLGSWVAQPLYKVDKFTFPDWERKETKGENSST
jgi:hypothetical protein